MKKKEYSLIDEKFPEFIIHEDKFVYNKRTQTKARTRQRGDTTIVILPYYIHEERKVREMSLDKLYRKYFQNYILDIPQDDKMLISDIYNKFKDNSKHIKGVLGLTKFDNYYICKNQHINKTIWSCNNHHWLKLDNRISNQGYYYVDLRNGLFKLYPKIHRLLALAFIPLPERFNDTFLHNIHVNHIGRNKKDGNTDKNAQLKLDNRICNLEWCTNSENHKHAHKTGLIPPMSEEARRNLSERQIGRKLSPETIAKLSGPNNPNYGKPRSQEVKDKISSIVKDYYKTHKSSFYGRHHTEDTKEKLRQINLGHSVAESTREKLRQANLGKTQSEETKQKRSESLKRYYKNNKPKSKYTDEFKDSVRAMYDTGDYTHRQLEQLLKINRKTIYRILNNLT